MGNQGLFWKLKTLSGKDIKGYLFPIKNYERAPLIWRTTVFIAYLHCLFTPQHPKAKQMQFWSRITPDNKCNILKNHTSLYSMFFLYKVFQNYLSWMWQYGPHKRLCRLSLVCLMWSWLIFTEGGLTYVKVISYGWGWWLLHKRCCRISFHLWLVTFSWPSFLPSSTSKI